MITVEWSIGACRQPHGDMLEKKVAESSASGPTGRRKRELWAWPGWRF